MDESMQRGCERMLHGGGDSPASAPGHGSNMPQTDPQGERAAGEGSAMSVPIQFLNRMFAMNSLYITQNLLNINSCL